MLTSPNKEHEVMEIVKVNEDKATVIVTAELPLSYYEKIVKVYSDVPKEQKTFSLQQFLGTHITLSVDAEDAES
jgi:hypothetical protein